MSAPRHALAHADAGRALARRIGLHDLMPPEARYRPRPATRRSVVGTFFFVFSAVFAALWFSIPAWFAFLLVGAYVGRAWVAPSSHVGAVHHNQSAVNLLNAGEVDEAAHIFDVLADSERNTAAHPVYVFNRAVAYVLQGRARRAYSLFNAVERSGAFSTGPASAYLPLLYIELGTCLALLGQLDQAEHYRKLAHQRLGDGEHGRAVFLDALVLVRTGQLERAEDYVRQHWREAEGMLRVPTMKALRLVHAFNLSRTRGPRAPEVRTLVETVRPCRRGEFDWVGANWGEMLAFLDEQGP